MNEMFDFQSIKASMYKCLTISQNYLLIEISSILVTYVAAIVDSGLNAQNSSGSSFTFPYICRIKLVMHYSSAVRIYSIEKLVFKNILYQLSMTTLEQTENRFLPKKIYTRRILIRLLIFTYLL